MTENYISQDTAQRKRTPMAAGLLDYFPAALAAVAEHSFIGNEKHNPGLPLHWSRGNSSDHADCIVRHVVDRGTFEYVTYNGEEYKVRHSAALAWRALALLQEELEAEGMSPGRGSRFPEELHIGVDLASPGGDRSAIATWYKDKLFLHGSQWVEQGLDDLAKARGHKHAQPLSFNKLPTCGVSPADVAKFYSGDYDVRVVADEPSFELTPKGRAEVAKKPARRKKRATPKPARKRK